MNNHNSPENESAARNSIGRKITTIPARETAKVLNKLFPWLTPNDVSLLGSLGLLVLVLYTAKLEKNNEINSQTSKKLVLWLLGSTATDGLDGGLARYLKSMDIEYLDKDRFVKLLLMLGVLDADSSLDIGPDFDSFLDRIQEGVTSWLGIFRAVEQGDKLWMATATLVALTNPLTSLVRAYAEKNGIEVDESGKSLFEFLGTRGGRFLTAIFKFLPTMSVGKVSIQALADGLTASANIKTTISRVKAIRDARNSSEEEAKQEVKDQDNDKKTGLTEAEIENAARRFPLLAGLAVITTSITGIILAKSLKTIQKSS